MDETSLSKLFSIAYHAVSQVKNFLSLATEELEGGGKVSDIAEEEEMEEQTSPSAGEEVTPSGENVKQITEMTPSGENVNEQNTSKGLLEDILCSESEKVGQDNVREGEEEDGDQAPDEISSKTAQSSTLDDRDKSSLLNKNKDAATIADVDDVLLIENSDNIDMNENGTVGKYDNEAKKADDKRTKKKKKKKGKKSSAGLPMPEDLACDPEMRKYWHQRYRLFSLFDDGIKMDRGTQMI